MRLIDAEQLITEIEMGIGNLYNHDIILGMKFAINHINNRPTAYNPEKVVEELEKRSKEYNSGVRLHGKPEEMLTHEAIDIVKRGGIYE